MVNTPIMRCKPYMQFIAENALHQVQLADGSVWKYYESGSDDSGSCVVCIHGSSGTCHGFFMQVEELSKLGYRVLSVGYPAVYSHEEWATSFDRLLDHLRIRQAHLYGTSLGGFLAQVYTHMFPSRVASLALTNALCDTTLFAENASLPVGLYAYMPDFYLRNVLLESFPKDDLLPAGVGDAVDFQVTQLETLSQAELASRITLNVIPGMSSRISRLHCLQLSDEKITFIDPMDKVSLSHSLREQLYSVHPEAKHALLKSGGDFPYISRYDEINMHLIVHLRRNGYPEPLRKDDVQKDSQQEDSQPKDSQPKDSQKENSQQKDSQKENSQQKDSQHEDAFDMDKNKVKKEEESFVEQMDDEIHL